MLGDFDYDFDINKQFGEVGEFRDVGARRNAAQITVQHDAIAYSIETGYTFSNHPWQPRISASYIYGSGNKSPFDSVNQTFDAFYGFNQPFSRDDYIAWNNVRDPKVRLEFTPAKDVQIDTSFSAYWLASSAAAWDRANLYAPLGNRGTFMGTEFDLRIRHKLSQFISWSASYARFWPGSFTSSFAPPTALQWPPGSYSGQTGTTNGLTAKPTDFFYLEVTANAFGDGNPIAKPPGAEVFAAVTAPGAPAAAGPSWTDIYVGLNAGGSWSNAPSRVQVASLGPSASSQAVAASAAPYGSNNHLAGFFGGLQLGANWKFARSLVAGFETDLQGVSGNTDTQWGVGSARSGADTFLTYNQRPTTLNYLGTARGRLGYLATPSFLLYGTGGLAYGGVISNTALISRRVAGSNQTFANPSYDSMLAGWTAGGGVEWAPIPNWSAKVEYLHYDLGDATTYGGAAATNGAYSYGVPNTTRFNGDLVRAGVSRHFELGAALFK